MTSEDTLPVPAEEAVPVLLVDDEPSIVAALRRELRGRPFELTTCTDPLQARAAAQAREFALVVSDNMMPGLLGLHLLADIKSHHPDTRRILLTGRTDLEQAIRAFNEGAIHRFLKKPWERSELLAVLDEELKLYRDRRRERESSADLEKHAKQRDSLLQNVLTELRQARTQLALRSDAAKAGTLLLPASVRSLSFLIVDGHPGVRESIVNTLRKAGIQECQAAGSGDEALAFLQYSPAVDVVLAEWSMSPMDGMALFNELRMGSTDALRPGSTLSANAIFILMTARERREAVEFAIKSGVDGYIIKPFHLDALLAQVQRALQQSLRQISQGLRAIRPLSFLVANADRVSSARLDHMLATNGIRNVALVDSGQKALRHCQDHKIDILIYDCNIRDPYWSDIESAFADADLRLPALLITSAVPLRKEFDEVAAAGLNNFFAGPFKPKPFFLTLFKACQALAGPMLPEQS